MKQRRNFNLKFVKENSTSTQGDMQHLQFRDNVIQLVSKYRTCSFHICYHFRMIKIKKKKKRKKKNVKFSHFVLEKYRLPLQV